MAEKIANIDLPVTRDTKIIAPTNIVTKLNPNVPIPPDMQKRQDELQAYGDKKLQSLGNYGTGKKELLSRDAKDINIEKTYQKGLEKAIGVITFFIIDAETKTRELLYGKYVATENETNVIKKALDKGIINLLKVVASVDFCNLVNYAIGQVPGGQKFDPDPNKAPTDKLGKKKWWIQKRAYDLQSYIDDYYAEYGDAKNEKSKLGLFVLTQKIKATFDFLLAPDNGLNDPEVISAFPQVSNYGNFLQNVLGIFNRYTDLRQIPNSELQKIIRQVDQVRGIAISIQGLNTVASAISLADTFTKGAVSDEIAKLSREIPVNKLIPALKSILKTANKINSVGRKIVGYINSTKFLIKLLMGLIYIFNVIKAYFFALPLFPTPAGVDIKLSDVVQNKINELGNRKLIRRLGQINSVLSYMSSFATFLISGMVDIIGKLQLILLNIENCNNVDPGLAQEIASTINNLVETVNSLQDFLSKYEENKNKLNNNFGQYQIKIVDEQLTDEGIPLKRRYGVALDINGVLAVQTTPTFASLDQIIINEVKVLLVAKGLVNSNFSAFPIEDIEIINDALNYTGDIDVNIDDMQFTNFSSGLDDPDNTDSEEGLGLNAFMNNLSGGKALRRRIRKMMLKQNQQLTTDLKKTDPNGKYTSGIIKEKESETKQIKINELEAERGKLKTTLATTTNKADFVSIAKKIAELDLQIKELKNQ